MTIKQDKNNKVVPQSGIIKGDEESILYCKSFLKAQKEQAMKTRYQQRFEKGLEEITASMRNKEGKQIHVRTCTEPETFHRSIYNALKLKHSPLGAKRTKI